MTRVDQYAQNYYNPAYVRTESPKAGKTEKTESGRAKDKEAAKLSAGAQKVLDELKQKYGNMDFMVADFENADEARDILSRSSKEFSVLFSAEELEKMASDESYKEKNIGRIESAVAFSNRINEQFGYGTGDPTVGVKQVGVSFNSDGTVSYFAELEKVSERQRERIEESREKKAEEKKAEEKKADARTADYQRYGQATKSYYASADSEEELLEKLSEIDWSDVKERPWMYASRFDYSI